MMAEKLSDALLQHRPRERSGSVSGNRFAFQRTWAFCHLLTLHESGVEYVLLLEFHDDVMVLDSANDPKQADFYQVKTLRNGYWNTGALTKVAGRQKKAPPGDVGDPPGSILGKLLYHVQAFGPHIRTLNVVSNARYNLPLANKNPSKDRDNICLLEFTPEAQAGVMDCLCKELGSVVDLPLDRVFLLATGISLTDHEKYGAGELSRVLDARRPNSRVAVQALYRTISDEIARRSNNEWEPTSFSDLCRRKGICRAEVERFLQQTENQPDPQVALEAVKTQLAQEQLDYRDILDVGFAWSRYQVQVTDHSDDTTMEFQRRVRETVLDCMKQGGWKRLRDLLELAEASFIEMYGEVQQPLDRKLLKGAILLEHKAIEARGLQAPDSQSPKKTP